MQSHCSRSAQNRIPIRKVIVMTGFVPMMWAAWILFMVVFAAVSLYTAHLAKNEEDQLYLYDSSSHIKAEQQIMLAKVQKVEPVKHVAMALAGLMTLVVIGYYILNMVNQFR
jgi:hypothetical protein